jgi:hypothetical protein
MSTVSSFEGDHRKPKGEVLFTGPDGVGNYKVEVKEASYIGHSTMSPEATSDTRYLCRGATGCPHPTSRSHKVGEVGWGVPTNVDHSLLKSGHQIMLKEFRQQVEDRHTHLYQEPYYDPPHITNTQSNINKNSETTLLEAKSTTTNSDIGSTTSE